jgi:hypothetical protein
MRTCWTLAPALSLSLSLSLAGCSDDSMSAIDDDPEEIDKQNGACTALEGRSFSSVAQHECGLTPNGPAMCNWQLTFTALDPQRSMFMWSHSDVGESGSVRCTGRQLSTDGIGRVYTGSYDPGSAVLTWDGLPYAPR